METKQMQNNNSSGWQNVTIAEVAKIITGNKDTQNKVDDGLYPFFVRSQTDRKSVV